MSEQDSLAWQDQPIENPTPESNNNSIKQSFLNLTYPHVRPKNVPLSDDQLALYNIHVGSLGDLLDKRINLIEPSITIANSINSPEGILTLLLSDSDDANTIKHNSYMILYSSFIAQRHKDIATKSAKELYKNPIWKDESKENLGYRIVELEKLYSWFSSGNILDWHYNNVALREIFALPMPLSINSIKAIYPLFEDTHTWDAERFLTMLMFFRTASIQSDIEGTPLTSSSLPKVIPEFVQARDVSFNFTTVCYNSLLFNRYKNASKKFQDIDLQAIYNILTPDSFLNLFLGIKMVNNLAIEPTSFQELIRSDLIPYLSEESKKILIAKQREVFSFYLHGKVDEHIFKLYETNQASNFAQKIQASMLQGEQLNTDISLFLNTFGRIKDFAAEPIPLKLKDSPISQIIVRNQKCDDSKFIAFEIHGKDENEVLVLEVDKYGFYVGIPHQVKNPESFFFPVMQQLQEERIIQRTPSPHIKRVVIQKEPNAQSTPALIGDEESNEQVNEQVPDAPPEGLLILTAALKKEMPNYPMNKVAARLYERIQDGDLGIEEMVDQEKIATYTVSGYLIKINVTDMNNPFITKVTKTKK